MARFIKCTVPRIHRDYYGEITNHPVNIDLCTQVKKIDEQDGWGGSNFAIEFVGCGVTWYYGKK